MQTVEVAQKKKPKTDAVAASLKNVREQKELERKIEEIDRLWHLELKNLTRDKLEVVFDLTKLDEERKHLQYLNDQLHGNSLKEYSEKIRRQTLVTREGDKNSHKYNFKSNGENNLHVHLPEVEKPVSILKQNGLQQSMPPLLKPKLYRSNSIVLQRISSDNNVLSPPENPVSTPSITRTESKENAGKFTFCLPDITVMEQSKIKFSKKMDKVRNTTLTAIPDDANATPRTPFTRRKKGPRKCDLPPLSGGIQPRRHTVL